MEEDENPSSAHLYPRLVELCRPRQLLAAVNIGIMGFRERSF